MWATAATLAASYWQNRQAKKRASEQMRYQTNMSNTSYQRAMADMKAAGLNPILAAKLGGASTPTGAMAQTPDTASHLSKGISTDNLKKLQNAQVTSAQATASNLVQQERLNKQNADYFDNKSYGSAVLNARPMNIFLTELMERNPEIFDLASDAITKALETAKDPLSVLKSLITGDLNIGSTAKEIEKNPKIFKKIVNDMNIKTAPISKVKNITPTSRKFRNFYRHSKRWWN